MGWQKISLGGIIYTNIVLFIIILSWLIFITFGIFFSGARGKDLPRQQAKDTIQLISRNTIISLLEEKK